MEVKSNKILFYLRNWFKFDALIFYSKYYIVNTKRYFFNHLDIHSHNQDWIIFKIIPF